MDENGSHSFCTWCVNKGPLLAKIDKINRFCTCFIFPTLKKRAVETFTYFRDFTTRWQKQSLNIEIMSSPLAAIYGNFEHFR